ncbi:hypothetical protein ACOMHN_035749 [Nucella lapillus]
MRSNSRPEITVPTSPCTKHPPPFNRSISVGGNMGPPSMHQHHHNGNTSNGHSDDKEEDGGRCRPFHPAPANAALRHLPPPPQTHRGYQGPIPRARVRVWGLLWPRYR